MALNEKEEEEDAEKAWKTKFVEEEPAGLVSGIKIKHLAKVSRRTDNMNQNVNMSIHCRGGRWCKYKRKKKKKRAKVT